MAPSLAFRDTQRERRIFVVRASVLLAAAMLLVGGLFLRLVQLQVWEHETYRTRSEANRIQLQPLAPPRGLIFDRNGVLLASNRPVSALNIVRERVTDMDALLTELTVLLSLSEDDLTGFRARLGRARRPFESVVLKQVLSEEEIARLAVHRHRLAGVEITTQFLRHYPFGPEFAHALGAMGRIDEDDLKRLDPVRYSATRFVGKRGAERFYESSLHGEVGHQKVEVDAHGRIRQVLDINPPIAGQNITLQLDSRLQRVAAEALGERRGAVVALDPRSGGILAMVSQPTYDPNLFITGISAADYRQLTADRDRPMFNRVINGQYAPGSTFKPFVGLTGIANGAIRWDERIEDRGWFRLKGQQRIYRDWSWTRGNSGGQGLVDLDRAIYRSSNVYFYDLASRMDIDRMSGFLAQFGFGQRTALDIPEASSGVLPSRAWKRGARGEPWYPGDSVNMGIGQGDVLVTPLQLATATMVIANRGRFVRPRLLLASDQPLVEFDPPPQLQDVQGLTVEDWERMVDAMENVVHRGNLGYRQSGTANAHIGQNLPYRIAGKSGTAQVVQIRQGEEYDERLLDEYQRKHAWFIGFAPADDPQIVMAVLVENGGGGSSIAAPVVRQVMDAYLLPQIVAR
ncbi:MAG: penicillin-binding protein 2 [Pseudomonadales bacterium]|nr:penicillin-binding protein 2 [Pseudomonadales bacterium]